MMYLTQPSIFKLILNYILALQIACFAIYQCTEIPQPFLRSPILTNQTYSPPYYYYRADQQAVCDISKKKWGPFLWTEVMVTLSKAFHFYLILISYANYRIFR
jgi:hypothetical protein